MLGLLGFIILQKDTFNSSLLMFIHVAVEVKEMSIGSFCDNLMNSDLVLDGNLETFSNLI